MPTLKGLPGTSGDVEAFAVRSRSAVLRCLRKQKAATAAGDHGALNVWIDDDGLFRCEFMRRCRTIDISRFAYVAAVDAWLRKWFPCLSVSSPE